MFDFFIFEMLLTDPHVLNYTPKALSSSAMTLPPTISLRELLWICKLQEMHLNWVNNLHPRWIYRYMQIDINGWGVCAMKIFVEQFSIIC